MRVFEQFPYCDRNPASGGLDLMPDLPVILRHQSQSLAGVGLVDSGASISVLTYSLGLQLGFDWNPASWFVFYLLAVGLREEEALSDHDKAVVMPGEEKTRNVRAALVALRVHSAPRSFGLPALDHNP